MAVKLTLPWLRYRPGQIVDLGAAVDEKLIRLGRAEKVAASVSKKAERPKGK
jgi:hypothetical protein